MERNGVGVAKISFGSFPRSGNHFFINLVDCKWLTHGIAPLELEENVVSTIRNPLDCIPSWITLSRDVRVNRAEMVLEWYCAYYEKCAEMNVFVIPFDTLISHPLSSVNSALTRYGLDPLDSVGYDLTAGFHRPTPDKSQYDTIREEMTDSPSFDRAMSLFGVLVRV